MEKDKECLARWEFTPNEWEVYSNTAAMLKKDDNLYFGIGILLVGVPYLMFFRGTSLLIALAFVVPFAVALPFLRNKIALSKIKKTEQNAYLSFYPKYIDLNGNKIELFAEKPSAVPPSPLESTEICH